MGFPTKMTCRCWQLALLGAMVAITWYPVPACGWGRLAVPDAGQTGFDWTEIMTKLWLSFFLPFPTLLIRISHAVLPSLANNSFRPATQSYMWFSSSVIAHRFGLGCFLFIWQAPHFGSPCTMVLWLLCFHKSQGHWNDWRFQGYQNIR